jgi:SAM-dependent methyltransferase
MRKPSVFAGLFGVYTLYGEMDYGTITERPGQGATADQNSMRRTRYELAAKYAGQREVLEIACGSGMGLGFLARTARRVVGGDIDADNCRIAAAAHCDDPRVDVIQCDGHSLPFSAYSFDVVLLFEAIYYLRNVDAFLSEVRRVLRLRGTLVISSVNCDWQGFNPSPFSTRYYNAAELREVLAEHGFDADVLVGFPDRNSSYFEWFVRFARTVAIALDVIPKTMSGKERLKRLFYGELKQMTAKDIEEPCRPSPVWPLEQVRDPAVQRMLYVVARAIGCEAATRHHSKRDEVLTFANK